MAAESSRTAHGPTAIFGGSDHQVTLSPNPPPSLSCSYGLVLHSTRFYIIVDAGFNDPVDVLVESTATLSRTLRRFEIKANYEGIKTVLDGAGRPYKTVRLIFTATNGSVVSARYVYFNRSGELVSLANREGDARSSMQVARFVLWCDYVRSDLPKAIKVVAELRKSGKEKEDEEICVICLMEYKAEDRIGTLRCKHSYHDECIMKWLRKTTRGVNCPLCGLIP